MESSEREYIGNGFAKRSFLISLLRVVARIIGFVRQIMIANIFGASSLTDAYFVAYQFQAVVGLLLGFGPFQSIVTTSVINEKKKNGDRYANILLGKIVSNQLVLGLLLISILFAFDKIWIKLIAPGFTPENAKVLMNLSHLILPGTLFLSLMSIASSGLYSIKIFIPSELSNALNSIIVLFSLIILYKISSIYSLGFGHFFGGVLSFALVLYFLHRYKVITFVKPNFSSPEIKELYILYISVGAFTIFNQIFVLAERHFASYLEPGKITAISLAHMLVGSILYTIISPMLLVIHTEISLAFTYSIEQFRDKFIKFLHIILYIMLPSSAILFMLSHNIITFLFYHGKFDWEAVSNTSIALKFFAVGLVFQGIYLYFLRVVTAMQSIKSYTFKAVISWAISIVLMWYLFQKYQYIGILISVVISFFVQAVLLFIIIISKLHLNFKHTFIPILKIVLITLISSVLSIATLKFQLIPLPSTPFMLRNLIILVCTTLIFLATYIGGSMLLKLEYFKYLVSFLRRKH